MKAMTQKGLLAIVLAGLVLGLVPAASTLAAGGEATEPALLEFEIKTRAVLSQDRHENWLWFHPKAAAIPAADGGPITAAVITLQKHLTADDHYSGIHVMYSKDLGGTWTAPEARPELAWRTDDAGCTVGVNAVTPGWHALSGKILAICQKKRWGKKGDHRMEIPGAMGFAYGVYDPNTNQWTPYRTLHLPDVETKFFHAAPSSAQWIVKNDGTLLVPINYSANKERTSYISTYSVTVLHCSFDGTTMKYLKHGDELVLNVGYGLTEPSLVLYEGRYYLTMRNVEKGYVTTSEDGMHFDPINPWTFDDGQELGSYNTQQHWLVHSDGLFLVYTRRGADNDNMSRRRYRAPLLIAQVDPQTVQVIRRTERVLIPNRGLAMGNFGATAMTPDESWVTVGECGSPGKAYVARVIWSKPSQLR